MLLLVPPTLLLDVLVGVVGEVVQGSASGDEEACKTDSAKRREGYGS
jgi:hypothetical protein